ncbi:MAG: hypothetical protein M3Q34_04210 [bacterium]|nr:hypothetical protein [bacterium]
MKNILFFLLFSPTFLFGQVDSTDQQKSKTTDPLVVVWIQPRVFVAPNYLPISAIDMYLNVADSLAGWGGGIFSSVYPSEVDGIDWAEVILFGSKVFSFQDSSYLQIELGVGVETPREPGYKFGRGSGVISFGKEQGIEAFLVFERNFGDSKNYYYIGNCMFPIKEFKLMEAYGGVFFQKNVFWGANMELRLRKIPVTFSFGGGWNIEAGNPGFAFGILFRNSE